MDFLPGLIKWCCVKKVEENGAEMRAYEVPASTTRIDASILKLPHLEKALLTFRDRLAHERIRKCYTGVLSIAGWNHGQLIGPSFRRMRM
jgi:hypothetical protein